MNRFIYPIFKKRKKTMIGNRGVAIQSAIPKSLDSIIARHINNGCENVLLNNQHGFVAGRSSQI